MKFKYSAIGKNTQENMEWLEKLGYKRGYHTYLSGNCIFTKDGFDYPYVTEAALNDYPNAIDCRNNPALFQAVTAIREDGDYMQWFVIDYFNEAIQEYKSVWRLCGDQKMDEDSLPYVNILLCHKATIEELIAHFKINK